jgi:hypothetical protein
MVPARPASMKLERTFAVRNFFVAIAMLALGLSAAQTATPEPTAEPPDCTVDGLKSYYAALAADAQDALDAAAPGANMPQDALAALYGAGVALQDRMLACGYIPADVESLPVGEGTSLERVMEILDTLTPDPLRGQLLYLGEERSAQNSTLGCAGCHEDGLIGPPTSGTWTRWDEQHRLRPEYEDHPFVYFAAEAVLYPDAHVEEPYQPNLMPPFYGTALSYQDLADIIAFLESQDQLPEDE